MTSVPFSAASSAAAAARAGAAVGQRPRRAARRAHGGGGGGGGAQAGGGGANNPLGGLMDMLAKSGLVEQAQSWVGTGENQPVSAEQIKEALPADTLQKVAEQTGVSPEQAADQIAQTLPQAVDKLTPTGEVPSGSLEDIIRAQKI
ncbi:YidB family protein [Streptomyces sp. MS1.HAVA.3]|uniref:YidB family protein n=1 Tax=Streptomyces caledonius TaxID=3134107 RepID=A0ABU8UAK5_9ACTN